MKKILLIAALGLVSVAGRTADAAGNPGPGEGYAGEGQEGESAADALKTERKSNNLNY